MKEEKENLKLNPYDRLQSIFSEKNSGKLTENAEEKLNALLGDEPKTNIFSKIAEFFNKVDRFIFKPRSRVFNNTFSKRKGNKRWH